MAATIPAQDGNVPGQFGDLVLSISMTTTASRRPLAVHVFWGVRSLGMVLRRTLVGNGLMSLQSRLVKLGHRLTNLVAKSRLILAEVLDVPLVQDEPRTTWGGLRARLHSELSAQHSKRIGGRGVRTVDQLPPDVGVLTRRGRLGWQQLDTHIRVVGLTPHFGVKFGNLSINRCVERSLA